MNGIVQAQKSHVWLLNGFVFNPLLFPMWVMFLISGMAETQRAPFDLTEAESELVAGYQTEYSSMSFALYWLGEYANVLLMCALNAVLFWGGYLPPLDWAPLYWVPGWIWLFGKILFFFFVFSWVKATVPRYRYDQLMRLGWKVFLPVSMMFVVLVSGWLMLTRYSTGKLANASCNIHQLVGDVPEQRQSLTLLVSRPDGWPKKGDPFRIVTNSEWQGSYRIAESESRDFSASYEVVSLSGLPALNYVASDVLGSGTLWLTDKSGAHWAGGCGPLASTRTST
jgi:NADH dehydrogenase